MQKNLNIEKITFKVAQIKFLAMHFTSVETRLLGALRKNKWGGGGVKCIGLCFTPSRIALTESARETRDCRTFTLHDLTDSAPH